MKIKTRIVISTGICLGVALVVAFMLYAPIQDTKQAALKYKNNTLLVQAVTDLIIATEEFLTFRYPRCEQQWIISYGKISDIVKTDPRYVQVLDSKLKELLSWFERIKLIETDKTSFPEQISTLSTLESRLSTNIRLAARSILRQILADSQVMSSTNFKLTNRAFLLTLASLAILILVFIVNAFFLIRNVLPPLGELINKTRRIMDGDLNQNFKPGQEGSIIREHDEIGELATVFDNMTKQLVGSLSDLENEAKERKLSEAKFRGIYEQSPIAIEIFNKNGKLADVNQKTLDLFGVEDKNYVLGFDLWTDPNIPAKDIQHLQNGQPIFVSSEFDFDLVKKKNLYPTSRSGKIYWDLFVIPIIKEGEIDGYLVQVLEVTERKKAEQDLRESEERLRQIAENIKEVFWVGSPDWKEVYYISPAYENIWGRSCDSLYAKPQSWLESIDEEDKAKVISTISEGGSPSSMIEFPEYRVVRPDGSIRWVFARAYPIKNTQGKVYRIAGIAEDITDKRKVDASLKAIKWLIEKSPGEVHQLSQYYGDLTALNTRRIILDNIGSDVLADIVQEYMALLDTSSAVYESNGDYAHGIFTSGWCRMLDAASRKLCDTDDNAEALCSGKWLCHESCWENASKVSVQTGKPVDIECHGGLNLYAVPIKVNEETVGSINFGYGDPPRQLQQIEEIAQKYRVDPTILLKEARAYESRPKFIIEMTKKRLENSAKLIGALLESKLTQKKLQQEQEQLSVTLQSIGDAVITTDIHGKIILINDVAQALTGWNREDACGRSLTDVFQIINEQTQTACENPVKKVLKTNEVVELANHTILISRDGTRRAIADSAAPIVDTCRNTIGVVLVFRDMTEKLDLENALRHAHKMEAIGKLAGGIAHEFNNILSIIIGNNELVMEELPEWSLARESTEEIRIAGMRARDVVKQLLTFSRKDNAVKKVMEFRSVVQESMKLIRSSTPANIGIKQTLPDDIYPVIGNETQINQLLINLCNNAVDAMPATGGILTIELSNEIVDKKMAKHHSNLVPGRYAKLVVSDNGMGMDKETIDRIFEPYYTTKDIGKGSGIGLAVVHGIVERHGGSIITDSNPGQGTVFSIFFPAYEGQAEQEIDEQEILPTGEESILYVDDEPSIAKLGKFHLEKLGYKAESTTDPLEALEMVKKNPGRFDLIISDMAMPNMTGDQLIVEILKLRPDMPTIICTGYSAKFSEKEAVEIGVGSFVMKPLDKAEFAKKVRKVLDTAKSSAPGVKLAINSI